MFVLDRGPASVIWPKYTQHEGEWEQTRDRFATQTCLVHVEMNPGPVHSDANDVQKITMLHLADVDGTGECFSMLLLGNVSNRDIGVRLFGRHRSRCAVIDSSFCIVKLTWPQKIVSAHDSDKSQT